MPFIMSARERAIFITQLAAFSSVATVALAPRSALAENSDQRAQLDEVVVTASPLRSGRDSLASIPEKVDRSQILLNGGSTIADALRDVPGVSGTNFASGASRPVIRGFDSNRVRLLENGVSSSDVSEIGPDHGVPIDPLSAQSIEVVRGAATLRYGSQAIGGVVNVIDNRIPLKLPDKPIAGEAAAAYGLNADSREGSGLLDARAGTFAFHADGFARNANDIRTPPGRQPSSFFQGNGYAAGSSYFFGADKKSRIGGAYVHYNAKYGIPNEFSFIDLHQDKGLFGSSLSLQAGALQTLNVDVGYANYTHSEIIPGEGISATFNNEEWDGRAEALFGAFGPFTAGAIGLQVQNRRFSALGEAADYLQPTLTQSQAGFAFVESRLSKTVQLQLATRLESVSVGGTPASDNFTHRRFTPISGSAGLLYTASGAVKLGLTLTSAARAPNQVELFARGAHDGPQTFETGDRLLQIERANSIEGTIRVKTDRATFEGALWGALFKDFIYGRLTGRTCETNGVCAEGLSLGLKELRYAQRNAIFWGAEAKLAWTIAQTKARGQLDGLILADYVRATFEGGGNVPRIAPFHIGTGLDWSSALVDVEIRATYTGSQTAIAFAETATKGFFSLDSALTVRPIRSQPNISLSLVGHNLTDSVERNAIAFNKDEVLLPGRDIRFLVRLSF